MQSIIGSTVQKAGEAVSSAVSSNKKTADMQPEMREPNTKESLTSDFGVKSGTHDNWLSASNGDRPGPLLLEYNFGRKKIMKFDHERIPERVVHARGAGAFGTFKLHEIAEEVSRCTIPAGIRG